MIFKNFVIKHKKWKLCDEEKKVKELLKNHRFKCLKLLKGKNIETCKNSPIRMFMKSTWFNYV